MGKNYSERQRNLPPSKRTYANPMKVPSGCVDVWRINVVDLNGNVSINSQWLSRENCMEHADNIHFTTTIGSGAVATNMRSILRYKTALRYVYVEHKAAVQIKDKFHIVNIPSFKLEDFKNDLKEETDPDLEHKQWLAEFEGKEEDLPRLHRAKSELKM